MRWLLAAARKGSLGASGARRWAQMAVQGTDISVVRELAPGGPGMSPAELSALADDLAAMFAGAGVPLTRDEITDAEADSLFPARSATEAAARERTVKAAAQHLRDMSDDELYGLLFPAGAVEPNGGVQAAGAPGHTAFTGEHTHDHPVYEYGDSGPASHVHPHVHRGEADHNHEHH